MTIGKRLRDLRKKGGYSVPQLAKKLGVSTSTIYGYESNSREASDEQKQKLAKIYNVSLDYLITGSETQPTTPTLYKNPNPRYAPLLGTASAGTPESVDQFIDEMLEIPNFIKHDPEHLFFIKVNGDSMNKLMGNGSTALILKSEHFTTQPKTGDIVVFKVDGEYCIKRFIETDTVVIFEPASYSDEFKPLVYVKGTSIDIEVIGKVIYTYNTWE
ncbi:MAG: LexA family protein [Culicoidibacterales bacterium]